MWTLIRAEMARKKLKSFLVRAVVIVFGGGVAVGVIVGLVLGWLLWK